MKYITLILSLVGLMIVACGKERSNKQFISSSVDTINWNTVDSTNGQYIFNRKTGK
jgi:hypothetical protein